LALIQRGIKVTMLITEQTRMRLTDLRDALTDAQAKPPPVTTAPPAPPLNADVMKQLTAQRPDLAKLIGDRATALQQRAQDVARAQDGLKQIYADALARVTTLLKG
jgi:hypothetical protein